MDVVLLLKGRSSRHCRANAPYSNTYTPQYLPLEANQNHHYQDKNIIHYHHLHQNVFCDT